jgi:peptidoglycan biosynthesis protein MviN/MurJ (putative lipid II flippase)
LPPAYLPPASLLPMVLCIFLFSFFLSYLGWRNSFFGVCWT